jgi:hypothetical protein
MRGENAMTTRTLPILDFDIELLSGDTFSQAISWKNAALAYVDLTAGTALAEIKANKTDTTAIDAFTVTLGKVAGNILLVMSASQTAGLAVGTHYYYDVQVTTAGVVRTYVQGRIKVKQDVSRVA